MFGILFESRLKLFRNGVRTKELESDTIIIRRGRIDIGATAMKTRGQAGAMNQAKSPATAGTDTVTTRATLRVDTTKQVSIEDPARPQPTRTLPRPPIRRQPQGEALQTSLAGTMTEPGIGRVALILETSETVANRRVDLTSSHDLIKPQLTRQMILWRSRQLTMTLLRQV